MSQKPMSVAKLFLIIFLVITGIKACTATLFSYQTRDDIGLYFAYLFLLVLILFFFSRIWQQYFPLPRLLRFIQAPFRGWVGRPNWQLQIEESSDAVIISSSCWRYISIISLALAIALGNGAYIYHHPEIHSFALALSLAFVIIATAICLDTIWIWGWRNPKVIVRSSSIDIWRGKRLIKTLWKHQLSHLEVEKYMSGENRGATHAMWRPNYILKACTDGNAPECLCTTSSFEQMERLETLVAKRLELTVRIAHTKLAGDTTPL
ncbi:MAG TPA: hypothetical protein VFT64_02185 [Rickettsiales bacterium]|nr:hypothetical protein [Rickettsiales bacterium]